MDNWYYLPWGEKIHFFTPPMHYGEFVYSVCSLSFERKWLDPGNADIHNRKKCKHCLRTLEKMKIKDDKA